MAILQACECEGLSSQPQLETHPLTHSPTHTQLMDLMER